MTSYRLGYIMTRLLRDDLEEWERRELISERNRLMDIEDEYRREEYEERMRYIREEGEDE
jgi:hypothetical protein